MKYFLAVRFVLDKLKSLNVSYWINLNILCNTLNILMLIYILSMTLTEHVAFLPRFFTFNIFLYFTAQGCNMMIFYTSKKITLRCISLLMAFITIINFAPLIIQLSSLIMFGQPHRD